jgi:hypothetical protein
VKLSRWPTASNARSAFSGNQRRLTGVVRAMGIPLLAGGTWQALRAAMPFFDTKRVFSGGATVRRGGAGTPQLLAYRHAQMRFQHRLLAMSLFYGGQVGGFRF